MPHGTSSPVVTSLGVPDGIAVAVGEPEGLPVDDVDVDGLALVAGEVEEGSAPSSLPEHPARRTVSTTAGARSCRGEDVGLEV